MRRPSRCLLAECARKGRWSAEALVLTVGANPAEVERVLAGGGLECPWCGGVLAGGGDARPRGLRGGRGPGGGRCGCAGGGPAAGGAERRTCSCRCSR